MLTKNEINAPYLDVAEQSPHGLSSSTQTLGIFAVAVGAMAFSPLLNVMGAPFAVGVLSLVAVAIASVVPAWMPSIAVIVLLFQNVFVSIFSPLIPDPATLDFIKGYNFLICSVFWLTTFFYFLMGQRNQSAPVRRLMLHGNVVISLVSLYFAYGYLQNGFAAAVYLRNIILPVFVFQTALLTSATFEIRATPTLVAIAIVFFICGYIELTFRDFWLYLTNGGTYWGFDEIKAAATGSWEREMRLTGHVPVDFLEKFKTSFLNTPLLDGFGLSDIYRILGPNTAAIGYAYGVCFFELFLFSVGRPLLAVLALPLAILCGVKGALVMMLFVLGSWLATFLIGAAATLWLGLAGLIAYLGFGLRVGLQIGDFHVIGFMGGWDGFLQSPFGRGLGSGGNLSDDFGLIDWGAAQRAGKVDGAVESSVGVLLYQMGIAAFAVLGFYFSIGVRVWRIFATSGILAQGHAAFAIFVVLVNGVFQEEALFAPPAMGLVMCLAGLVLGNAIRTKSDTQEI